MKIIIVGAGIGGSVLARIAREKGHDVYLVAKGDEPHSLAATAVLRRAYHGGKPDELAAFDYAVGQYQLWGIPMARGAFYSSYKNVNERLDQDWMLVDPAAPLVKPDLHAEVISVFGNKAWLGHGKYLTGDAVVAAVGAGSPLSPEGKLTWGVTWEHHGSSALRDPDLLHTYQWAPYKTLMCGVIGGMCRVGSSSASKKETAQEQGRKMLAHAARMGWLTTAEGWLPRLGARLQTPQQWWREPEGTWRLGGFHRTGYALAPLAASQLLEAIEESAE
jgi:Pyridine nucleotide-disulphide oxidoreductase